MATKEKQVPFLPLTIFQEAMLKEYLSTAVLARVIKDFINDSRTISEQHVTMRSIPTAELP